MFTSRNCFDIHDLVLQTIRFWYETGDWQTSFCYGGFYNLIFRQHFVIVIVVITIWFAITQPSTSPNAVWCYSYFISWHSDFGCGLFCLLDPEVGLTVDVTGQQRTLTPPRHLISYLVYPGVHACLIGRMWLVNRGRLLLLGTWSHILYIQGSMLVWLVLQTGRMVLMTVRYA
jgi:hypothetical protein